MPITFAAVIAVVSVCSAPGHCDSNRFNVKSFGTSGVALGAPYNPGNLYSYPKSGSSGVVQYQYGPSATSAPAPRSVTSKMPYSVGFGAPGSGYGGLPASFGSSSYGYGSSGIPFTISAPSGFQYYSPPGSFNWNATPPAGYQYTPSGYVWRGGNYRRNWTPSQLPNGARALKKVTTWEAPNASDKQFKEAIQNSEIDNGPDDPATVALILDAAKYYVKTKQYEKAEPMLKRLEKLGVSNAKLSNLRAGISAGLRPASAKITTTSHSSLNSGGGAVVGPPVLIQPPSSFEQVRGR